MSNLTVALLGQPNTGKSTLFNQLTGLNQHVGNWPGKTVEKRSGTLHYQGNTIEVVDLPGTYSLTANSEEERIARNYIIKEKPDVVITVLDASQLERSLYILSEALFMDIPVIAALNMTDVAEHKGVSLNIEVLQKQTGIRVFPMIASKNSGVEALKEYLCDKKGLQRDFNPVLPEYPGTFRRQVAELNDEISQLTLKDIPQAWLVTKIIENDTELLEEIKKETGSSKITSILENFTDGLLISSEMRFRWIQGVVKKAVSYNRQKNRRVYRFDRIATHPLIGPVVGVLSVMSALTVAFLIGGPPMFMVFSQIPFLAAGAASMLQGAPDWLIAAVSSGIIPGIMFPVSMTIFITGIYLVIGFLEDVGYMARLAYINDNLMQKMGLHGKSFMPMFMSFICNISGTLSSRVIDSWRQRLLTIVLSLIVPCMAIWGVTGFISAIFFGKYAVLIVILLLLTMVLYMLLTSLFLRGTVLKGKNTGLIMELPPYHKPNWKTIVRYTYTHAFGFFKKAGIYMIGVVILLWLVSYFPGKNIDRSYLALIGKMLEPVGSLMGMDWKMVACLLVGFISKEAVLASMAILFGITSSGAGGISVIDAMLQGVTFDSSAVSTFLFANITPNAAIAFIFALFFSIPCQGTAVTIYNETKSGKLTLGIVFYFVCTSLGMGMLAYHISKLFI